MRRRAAGYALEIDPRRSTAAASRTPAARAGALARADAERAAADLRAALALWRGPALADHRVDEFAQSEIARLEELRLEAIEERLAAELAAGAPPTWSASCGRSSPSTRCASGCARS